MLKAVGRRRMHAHRLVSGLAQPLTLLALVSFAFTVVQLVVVAPRLELGWDETVYVSQVSDHAPPSPWSPPRARGVTYLVAPVAFTLPSVEVLRIYLAVLSGLALFGSYALWLHVRRTRAVPLAAGLFGGFWVTLYYGPMVMPNLWVAFGAVAATALTVLACRQPYRPLPLIGLAASVAAVALVRPSDSFWLVAPICLAIGFRLVRSGGRAMLLPLAAVVVGELAGMAQWVVEAYQSFGGPMRRLHEGAEVNAQQPGDYVSNIVRTMNGPIFCNRCEADVSALDLAFWTMLALTTVLGLVVAYWRRRLRVALFLVGTAGVLASTYLFMMPLIAAPRYLLPAYAVLVLPIADGLTALPQAVPHRAKAITTVLALAVACYLVGEQVVLDRLVGDYQRVHLVVGATTKVLRDQGVRPPCLIAGNSSVEIAFQLGCNPRSPIVPGSKGVPGYIKEALPDKRMGVVARTKPPAGSYVEDWVELPVPGYPGWRVYLPPG
jgi:hypothetical protein